jgi:hypothetical protein
MAAGLCYGSRRGGARQAFHHRVGAYDTETLIGALGELRHFLGGQKATLLSDGLPPTAATRWVPGCAGSGPGHPPSGLLDPAPLRLVPVVSQRPCHWKERTSQQLIAQWLGVLLKTCQQEQQEGGGLRLLTFHSDRLGRVTIPED